MLAVMLFVIALVKTVTIIQIKQDLTVLPGHALECAEKCLIQIFPVDAYHARGILRLFHATLDF